MHSVRAYSTGFLTEMLNEFHQVMANPGQTRKFFYYSDHDTGMQMFACAFSYYWRIYIPFDTQMLWELT
jgi:hypothetical protein